MNIIVKDQIVEIPEGWIPVCGGRIQKNDRGLSGSTILYWTGELIDLIGEPVRDWYPIVIRHSSKLRDMESVKPTQHADFKAPG